MVRYSAMRRITQILASILFTITVLTTYIAFDFILNGTASKKSSLAKTTVSRLSEFKQTHSHLSHGTKITKQRSISNSSLKSSADHIEYPDKKRIHHSKLKQFPKGKTGVKLNKIRKVIKDRNRQLSINTTMSSHSQNGKNKNLKKRND